MTLGRLAQARVAGVVVGPGIAGDVLVDVSPLPRAAQKRPGNISPRVPIACATIAGCAR